MYGIITKRGIHRQLCGTLETNCLQHVGMLDIVKVLHSQAHFFRLSIYKQLQILLLKLSFSKFVMGVQGFGYVS